MEDLLFRVLITVLASDTIANILEHTGSIMTVSGLLDLMSSKLRKESLQDQMIICLDESLEEACKQLGWEYDSLAVSQNFDAQSFMKESIKSKAGLIDFFGALTGMQIDDKTADVFIKCFDKSVSNKPELQRYINSLKNQYDKEYEGKIEFRKYYKDRIIAFVDILGFKNLVERSARNIYTFKQILDSLDEFRKLKKKTEDQGYIDDVKVTTFSDSFVISYPAEKVDVDSLSSILLDLICLELYFLDFNIIVRGGVAIGKLRHTQNEIFGPAMNEAYYLESKVAKYPRIIICENTITDFLDKKGDKSGRKKLNNILRKDVGENFFYLDYLRKEELFKSSDEYSFMLQKTEDIIQDGKQSTEENIRQKYVWLEKYYRAIISKKKEGEFDETEINHYSISAK